LTARSGDATLVDHVDATHSRQDRRRPAALAPEDLFSADYRALDAVAGTLSARTWFDRATGGTDTVPYDMNYGPAFVLSPTHVMEIAAGLAAEGWHAGPEPSASTGEADADVDRSARALGEAAEWDPDEIEVYGPMMAATGTADFNVKVVRAIGTLAGWDAATIDRVANAVASAEPEELDFTNEEYDLAGFFATAAREGKAVVGGIN
jgi:hypothetical protein